MSKNLLPASPLPKVQARSWASGHEGMRITDSILQLIGDRYGAFIILTR